MTVFRDDARITGGANGSRRQLHAALEDAVIARGGINADPATLHAGHIDFVYGISLRNAASEIRSADGLGGAENPIDAEIKRSLELRSSSRSHGNDDFLGIVENINRKSLLLGYERAPAIHTKIARSTPLNDFRQHSRSGLSAMPLLQKTGENGEIKSMLLSATRSYITGSSYAGSYTVSREALLNDDMDALTKPLYEAGLLASATIDGALITMLTSNSGTGPTMTQDGVVLFHSSHANYDATSGAPLIGDLEIARQRLRVQKDSTGTRYLNIAAKYLLVPPDYETTARVLAASEAIPGQDAALEVVVAPQLLDGVDGTTAWYLLADPQIYDTLDVGLVSPEPELIPTERWSIDGQSSKISIAFGVAALDHRGMYRKKGA